LALRWFDRSRTAGPWPHRARSYVGPELRHVDNDLDATAHTLFELARPSLGTLSVIRRGLDRESIVGRGAGFVARTARVHFSGSVDGWLKIDRDVARTTVS